MKRMFALGVWMLVLSAFAQPHKVTRLAWQRAEVTKALDAVPEAEASRIIAPYKVSVDSVMAPPLGLSRVAMSASRPESLLGNWAADVMVEGSTATGLEPADMGLFNVGGLRNNMPEGIVRRGDIILISPFQNYLVVLELKGKHLLELMRNIAATGGEGVSSGVRLVIGEGGSLVSATLHGREIDPKRTYTVATIDYLAEGNDKMYALRKAKRRHETGLLARDVMMESVLKNRVIDSKIEGRITRLSPPKALPEGQSEQVEGRKKEVLLAEAPSSSSSSPTAFAAGGFSPSLFLAHTSDTHSCVEPLSPNMADTAQADKGGFLRRAALVQQWRAAHPDSLLLLDCGDFSQGSVYYNLFRGEVEVQLMNAMGYDAFTLGNHEFDFGLDNLARLLRMARFPAVCCNYDFTHTPCHGLVKPYIIIERAGVRVGIFGVCPQPAGLVTKQNYAGMRYTKPARAAQPVIDRLRGEEHCDLVICLSHLGWGDEPDQDKAFIAATHGIDILLGGHTHTSLAHPEQVRDAEGHDVTVCHVGKNARHVGMMTIGME